MILSLTFNVGLLSLFKYLDFSILNINRIFNTSLPLTKIALPIGISFFTFKAISYCIDVYRSRISAQKNFLNVGIYISFFPQLFAGPIARYENLDEQLNNLHMRLDDFTLGTKRFVIGLGKKVLLADILSVIAVQAFDVIVPGELSISMAWLGAIAYTMQIFFDFSGYSDMAIGLGLMFGFHTKENFNYPYISKSVSEFWRRWHISLGEWFRDYVYFPLGGSRGLGNIRVLLNLFIVWFLTGLWHGADWTFVLWGMMYFILISFEKITNFPNRLKTKHSVVMYSIFTFLCVMFGWVVFRSSGIKNAAYYILSMFGLMGNTAYDRQTLFYLSGNRYFLIAAIFLSMPCIPIIKNKLATYKGVLAVANIIVPVFYVLVFMLSVSYIVVQGHNPFLYFDF